MQDDKSQLAVRYSKQRTPSTESPPAWKWRDQAVEGLLPPPPWYDKKEKKEQLENPPFVVN